MAVPERADERVSIGGEVEMDEACDASKTSALVRRRGTRAPEVIRAAKAFKLVREQERVSDIGSVVTKAFETEYALSGAGSGASR